MTPRTLLIPACALLLALCADGGGVLAAPRAESARGPAKKARRGAEARGRVVAKGPAVTRRRGVMRLGRIPPDRGVDDARAQNFGPMKLSAHTLAFLRKHAGESLLELTGKIRLSPDAPSKGGLILSGHDVDWRGGAGSWVEPEIRVRPEGGVSIRFPVDETVASGDLMVECKGGFASKMSVRGHAYSSAGLQTTSAAEFSMVTNTLKFMITVPELVDYERLFSIGLSSTDDEFWTLEACVLEKL